MVENNPMSSDRVILLEKIEGKNVLTNTGLIDNRLFTGENKLHAVMDGTGLWTLRYDAGLVPEALRQQFTSFSILMQTLKEYFRKRNIKIKEIVS